MFSRSAKIYEWLGIKSDSYNITKSFKLRRWVVVKPFKTLAVRALSDIKYLAFAPCFISDKALLLVSN